MSAFGSSCTRCLRNDSIHISASLSEISLFLAHRRQKSESLVSHYKSDVLLSCISLPCRIASNVLEGLLHILLVGSSLDKLVAVVSSSIGGISDSSSIQ